MVLVVAGWLPLAVAEAGGRALGSAVAASRAYRWAVAVENVAVALPGTTDRGAAEVAAEALAHLGAVAALLPHAGAMGAAAAAGTGGDVAAVAAELTGQPAIVVSAHVGWWEALPAAVGTWLAPDQLMWVAYAPLADVALDAAVAAVRAAAVPQMRLIPARGAYKVLDAALRRGDVVGLMGDAFAPVAVATGPPVVFAGRRLRGRTGAARLAAATGAPRPGWCWSA
ncbi:uncharacterized protein AMSG_10972 [Thecamonas trahens ATCC 50062]|uniref:Uncharacterized protein n=1 Tax=Thecamonas trahens ATCC 50062 TaxID=461836 RepID=A0A0L0DSX6_THETB|nr:hypothetical protein AMSG_10972 [Thecamonas trahens ATCC 50062]KNC55327.1 hypothetical protein AMSG_10972 [Thecamonas trahens ATCC 50062]|eukprot:XP_013753050.1 hypothetical protein AMSG_10972 [Thecamonas trahens ATCC 50062]